MTEQTENKKDYSDAEWADLLSPGRRKLILGTGVAAALLGASGIANAQGVPQGAGSDGFNPGSANGNGGFPLPPHKKREPSKSEWGDETYKEATVQPAGYRPGEATIPTKPQPYTRIKSYHAHIYFDDSTYEKAAVLRKWVSDRFNVELGHWNKTPAGPHVTPSYYFGFKKEQLPIIFPWLQLNSLGLTILIHPNSDDMRADHLYYAAWINRAQPVNGYGLPQNLVGDQIDPIYPNTKPSVKLEV